jgi:nucleoid DNA-binding protein
LKLAPLLAEYLSTNKKLSLRGIGVFQSAPAAYVETSYSKNAKVPSQDISFTNNPSATEDEELVKFICAQTGKMKALAASDVESYLELMQQFLNIGKPFQIEGIGTLVKIKPGLYEFTSGQQLNEKIADTSVKELTSTSTTDDSLSGFKQIYPRHSKAGFTLTKSFIAILLLGGIGFAIWGGYTLYNRNMNVAANDDKGDKKEIVPVDDSTTLASVQKPLADTVKKITPSAAPGYKFVFETTHSKKRAINRFNILKQINSDIHLETIDSTLFNITVSLNIPATDTTRVKDSLNSWYYGKKDMLVKIASPNSTSNVP